MTKSLTLLLAIVLAASVYAGIDIREGELTTLSIVDAADVELIKNTGGIATKSLKPKENHQFAVLTIILAAGKSIGLYDYTLQSEDNTDKFDTLAMSINEGVYQRRIWEARAKIQTYLQLPWQQTLSTEKSHEKGSIQCRANTIIKLLFEVPTDTKRFRLTSRLLDENLQKEYAVKVILDFDSLTLPGSTAEKGK